MQHSLQYTAAKLDRADKLRRSDKEISKLWEHHQCRVVPVYNNKHLFDASDQPVLPLAAELSRQKINTSARSFLGLNDGVPYFSIVFDATDAEQLQTRFAGSQFCDLRTLAAALNSELASILAYARGLAHWQRSSGYCGRCGGRNKLVAAGHAMQCTQCQSQVFPRTDPAVIMLVEHTNDHGVSRCLLGRSPAWPERCYSTLAGFVETGESLEAAVIREVHEESGIVVDNPTYVTSQPWPFPQSIMLGFVASAATTDITLDPAELADARWFSVKEVESFGEWADASNGYKLPRKDSIARFLIDRWIAEQQQNQ